MGIAEGMTESGRMRNRLARLDVQGSAGVSESTRAALVRLNDVNEVAWNPFPVGTDRNIGFN